MEKIYIIEDEENIRNLITVAMEGFGYETKAFENAEDALAYSKQNKPDLMIFDRMLPGMDGLEAICKIREDSILCQIPILVLTAKDKELDKVKGLDKGADDYMTKPFGILELGARVRNLLKRNRRENSSDKEISFGKLMINHKTHEVKYENKEIPLTRKEYQLLWYLYEHRDKVVTRDELLNQVWGYDYDGETRTLDIHIRTLRQKLGEESQEYVKTIRGVGYRLVNPT